MPFSIGVGGSQPPGGGGGTPSGTTGQVQYNNNGAFGSIAEGTSGQVLTSNGAAKAPSFQNSSGGSGLTAPIIALVGTPSGPLWNYPQAPSGFWTNDTFFDPGPGCTIDAVYDAAGNGWGNIAGLTSIDFTNIVSIPFGIALTAPNAGLISLTFPALVVSSTPLQIASYTGLTSFDLPLFKAGIVITVTSCTSIVTLGFEALVAVIGNGGVAIAVDGNTAMTTVNFSAVGTLNVVNGNVAFTNCALLQASVDAILVGLAALDGTGSTIAYANFTVDLSGGTNATPSAAGLAAKATLIGRGCTVTTN